MMNQKKAWVKPDFQPIQFAAEEYISACTPSNHYIFNCNTPSGYVVCLDPLFQSTLGSSIYGSKSTEYTSDGSEIWVASAHGCNYNATEESFDPHYVAFEGEYIVNGWQDYNSNKQKDENEDILVWMQKNDEGGYDMPHVHLTDKIDMSTWEVTRS